MFTRQSLQRNEKIVSDSSSIGNTSATTTEERTYFLEVSLRTIPRLGVFKTVASVDRMLRTNVVATLKKCGIRFENVETSITSLSGMWAYRHKMVAVSCNITCDAQHRKILDNELRNVLAEIQFDRKRAHSPRVITHKPREN